MEIELVTVGGTGESNFPDSIYIYYAVLGSKENDKLAPDCATMKVH